MKIFVEVKPGKKNQKIVQKDDLHFIIEVHALAKEGEANRELVEVLSRYFKVSKNCVILEKGESVRYKTFRILK